MLPITAIKERSIITFTNNKTGKQARFDKNIPIFTDNREYIDKYVFN